MRLNFSEVKKSVILLLVILTLGVFLRVYKLTYFPMFGDEAIYIRWSQQMREFPELRFVSLSDGKQPLFMWSVIPFLKIFSDPLYAGRLVSVLTGMGTVFGVFILTVLLFNKEVKKDKIPDFAIFIKNAFKDETGLRIGLLATFLYAISPFSIFFDRMALADSMLSLFGIWTVIFALFTILFLRLDTAILAGFALGGAFLTKSPATFFAILLPSVILFRLLKDEKLNLFDKHLYLIAPLFIVTYAISQVMFNILRLGPDFHMLEMRTMDYVYPISHLLDSPFDPLLPFLNRIFEYLIILGPGIILILIVLGMYFLFKRNKAALIVLIIWSVIPLLIIAEFTKVLTARYIYFAIPYFYIIAAASLYSSGLMKKVVIFGVVMFSLLSFRWHAVYFTDLEELPLPRSERSGYLEEWTSGIGVRESADIIQRINEENSDQEIVVGTEGHFGTLPQGLEIYFQNIPRVQIVGVGINIEEIPEELIQAKDEGKQVYLVVNQSRLKFDPLQNVENNLSLQLNTEFPKAKPPEGEKDKLILFELR